MLLPKKVIILFICVVSSLLAHAQSVKVRKESSRIKGENVEGYATDLEGKPQDVTTSFVKYLRSLGKVRQSDGVYVLTESTISASKNPIYCITKDHDTKATAWIGIVGSEWGVEASKINSAIEKTMYEFGVKFYRDKIQLQIDESNRAITAVEKQQQRYVTENKNLNAKLEDNKREKIQLEKNLVNNKTEFDLLLKKIAKNKHDQDSIAIANVQIKKVMAAQKEKQNKVK